jgi:hypothetical protein
MSNFDNINVNILIFFPQKKSNFISYERKLHYVDADWYALFGKRTIA